MPIESHQFLRIVRPALQSGDPAALAEAVLAHWKPGELCKFLTGGDLDTRRVAAMTLGLVGDRSCVGCLALALHDEDAQVNEMAEHGLWSIWFRMSKPAAVKPFREGMALVATESYELAIEQFHEAARLDPDFAEAHNQCSIARFFLGQWHESIRECEQAIARMPAHFGAMAGMGHCHAHLGDLSAALDCYRRSLEVNPHMPTIIRSVRRLERKLHIPTSSEGPVTINLKARAPRQ